MQSRPKRSRRRQLSKPTGPPPITATLDESMTTLLHYYYHHKQQKQLFSGQKWGKSSRYYSLQLFTIYFISSRKRKVLLCLLEFLSIFIRLFIVESKYKSMRSSLPPSDQIQLQTEHSLAESLLSTVPKHPPPSAMRRFKQYCLKEVQTDKRSIRLNGLVSPQNYQNNLVKNTKYNVFNFIPKVLYNQFKFFYNMFFLINALTQLVEILRVGLFITNIGPLIMVLTLTMCKQGYDDFNTYKRDIEANSKEYDVARDGGFVRIKSKDLKVGDIVRIVGGDRVPADMITLHSDGDQGTLFLKTDQLDGQTDWKLRKAVKMTQSFLQSGDDAPLLLKESFICHADAPNGEIYNFSGLLTHDEMSEKLTLENTLWATTVLTNGSVIGLVVYVGRETRISMGGSSPRTKFGILDMEINKLSKILFLIMALLTGTFIFLQQTQPNYIAIQFMRMLILLSSIIPISMRVNLDFAKLFFARLIDKDSYIPGAVTRNSNCPEELGRVKYVLSDKTGTLTQNDMLFRQISIDDETKFTNEQSAEIIQILKDYEGIEEGTYSKEEGLKNIVTALALCHNVTPVFNEDRTQKEFQASSPDQITFVKLAENFGLAIEERTQSTITIKNPNETLMEYEIKYSFPFKSQTKRMGILLRDRRSGQYVFYLKGADAVMKDFIANRQKRAFIEQQCKDLSMTGLRTLVITYKKLPEDFYKKWSAEYQKAYNRLDIDHKTITRLMNQLEYGVDFLGITGIEDKLQNSLKPTIENLRGGGIKIWMITGDKMETAECISRSCGLQRSTEENYKIEEAGDSDSWRQHWRRVKENLDHILIIDGKTLSFVLEDEAIKEDFFKVAMKLPTVICCRCSPSQKKLLTAGVKRYKEEKEAVLGIGDGGNDVGMIQQADVGVGIVGKEGMQAALAADFSIKQFRDLKTLLFWHGRLSYIRSSLLANFIIHRGFIISVIQLIFSCIFYYASIPIFNSYLQLGYATIFTFWPVFAMILDKDIDFQIAQNYPRLYESLQSADYLSVFNFFVWIWKASFQATVIIVLTLVMFQERSYLQFQTICFTVLMITEYFMTLTEINNLHCYLLGCIAGSLFCYILCLVFLNDYLHIAALAFQDFIFILIIFAASWSPLFLWKYSYPYPRLLRKRIWPNEVEKIMKTTKQKLISRNLYGRSLIQGDDNFMIN